MDQIKLLSFSVTFYGAKNENELKGLKRKSFVIILASSLVMFILAEVLAKPLSSIFVGYDKELLELTVRGFHIYSFSFLFAGIAIFGSSFFTALNDGAISAIISFLRTLVFQISAVLLFPLISSTLLSLKLKKYIIFNNAISILFSLTVIFTLFLTWQYKKIIYSCAIVLYFIWLFWFVFLIYRYLYFKRENK